MINIYSTLIPLAILLPNLMFIFFKPSNKAELEMSNLESQKLLNILEGIGRLCVFIIPIFYPIQIKNKLDLVVSIGLLLTLMLYYLGWVRYYHNKRNNIYLFKPFIKIPVPMAITPVLYFIFSSLLLKSIPLFIGAVIFGIGHISLSLRQYKLLAK